MIKFLNESRFLAIYSGVLTIAFTATTALNILHGSRVVSAEQRDFHHPDFDQITVHRINVVEPDGTPRLVISNKAEYPGGFFNGKELTRPDRADAGFLFMNNEGTENGGLLFGGERTPDGKVHSYGHLSFDEYEQDQTMSLDTNQDGEDRSASYVINDNANETLLTPEVMSAFSTVKAMPEGPARQKAWKDVRAKYPTHVQQRALLGRMSDRSAVLFLRDPQGHARLKLRVAEDGTPSIQFLDANGKVTRQWLEGSALPRRNGK